MATYLFIKSFLSNFFSSGRNYAFSPCPEFVVFDASAATASLCPSCLHTILKSVSTLFPLDVLNSAWDHPSQMAITCPEHLGSPAQIPDGRLPSDAF
jgi:hypothetical protein